MQKMKRNYLAELWWNRPWKYIPAVVRYMKDYPYHKRPRNNFKWVRECLFANWQHCWKWVGK